jgi:hypothetical protein
VASGTGASVADGIEASAAASGVASAGVSVVLVDAGGVSFWKRASTGTTICCSPAGPISILPITSLPGDLIGGAAAETAGVIPGIVGLASTPAGGAASFGPVEPASGEGVGGGGGGASAEASGVVGSSCSKMIPEISLSIICLINGETASRTAFFASAAAASLSFFASIKASWYKGVDISLNS